MNKKLKRRLENAYGKPPEREYGEGDMTYLRSYHDMKQETEAFSLDDITWDDLSMDRLYRRVNACQTTAGEQALYHLMRTPALNEAAYAGRREAIGLFAQNAELRLKVQQVLYRLGHAGHADLCRVFKPGKPAWRWMLLYLALAALPVLCLALLLSGIPQAMIVLLLSAVGNVVFHTWRLNRIQYEFSRVSYSVRMLRALKALFRLGQPALNALLGPEARDALEKCRPLMRMGTAGAMSTSDLGAMVSSLFMTDLLLHELIKNRMAKRHAEVLCVFEALGLTDAAISIGSYRQCAKDWCEPDIRFDERAPRLHATGLRHPLIDNAVPNDFDGSVLLTGSNASGKSTYLKAAALCAVLAQTLCTAPAERCELSPMRVYTSMALKDDLSAGESYYIVEIRSIKRILDAAARGESVFCAVDEVLRGTNTVERIAASSEIIRALLASGALCAVATHDVELCGLLVDACPLKHFEERIENGQMVFDYRLHEGAAFTRNAIRLLDLMGYPDGITHAATQRAERFLQTGRWQ